MLSAKTCNRLYALAVICLAVAALGVVFGPIELGALALVAMLVYVPTNRLDPRDDWHRDLWGDRS